jgi:2-haloacid dehalogenase
VANQAQIDAVVFDIGGVLLDWNPAYLYERLLPDPAERERFLTEVGTLEWHAAHDRGVSYDENAAALIAAHPEHAAAIRAWSERSEEMERGDIPDGVAALRAVLDTGIPVYALTNMESDTYERRRNRYPWMSWFRGTVVSSHEGVVKPEPELFQRLLERFDLDAKRTLMIDDSARNIATAAGLGMPTIHVVEPARLSDQLHDAGVL